MTWTSTRVFCQIGWRRWRSSGWTISPRVSHHHHGNACASGQRELFSSSSSSSCFSRHVVLVEEASPSSVDGGDASRKKDMAPISVFWYLNDCVVPEDSDPHCIGPNIISALRMSGFHGPVSISAYCVTRQPMNEDVLRALAATGVDLHYISGGAIKDSMNHLIVDLLLWAKHNPPPLHVFLISGERGFSSILHKLHMKGYNILCAYPEGRAYMELLSVTCKVWSWDNITKGIGLVARSCINGTVLKKGNYYSSTNDTLQNFSHSDAHLNQIAQSEIEDKNYCLHFDRKNNLPDIPQMVIEQVINIVKLRPQGLSLPALRHHVVKSQLLPKKGLFGHKDFFSFFLAIPGLDVKIWWTSDKKKVCRFTVVGEEGAPMPVKDGEAPLSLQNVATWKPVNDDRGVNSKDDATNTSAEARSSNAPRSSFIGSNLLGKLRKIIGV